MYFSSDSLSRASLPAPSSKERFTETEGKYVLTGIFMLLFERMWALHGFQNTLVDLHLERERVEMLADRIVAFDLGVIRNIAQRFPGLIHGLIFSDLSVDDEDEADLGISPEKTQAMLDVFLKADPWRQAR